MMGDNLYGGNSDKDFKKKFEEPYKPLLDANIKFYASLGNHDNPNERLYKLFNMNGERYYTFRPKAGVRFFALDSNYMDKPQLAWLEKELAGQRLGLEDRLLPSSDLLVWRRSTDPTSSCASCSSRSS